MTWSSDPAFLLWPCPDPRSSVWKSCCWRLLYSLTLFADEHLRSIDQVYPHYCTSKQLLRLDHLTWSGDLAWYDLDLICCQKLRNHQGTGVQRVAALRIAMFWLSVTNLRGSQVTGTLSRRELTQCDALPGKIMNYPQNWCKHKI